MARMTFEAHRHMDSGLLVRRPQREDDPPSDRIRRQLDSIVRTLDEAKSQNVIHHESWHIGFPLGEFDISRSVELAPADPVEYTDLQLDYSS